MSEGTKRGACPGGPARDAGSEPVWTGEAGKKPPAAGSAQSGGAAGGVRRRLWVLLTQVYLVTQASGNEMFPAVKDGDLVLGCRLEKDYAKNDVVVYERSGTLRVGRVLARGGDIVTLSESGVVEVNGSAQGGGILYPTYPKSLLSYPYAVPEDSVFILGDCRTQAEDSRDFGPVQCSAVKAKVITLIRRRGL